MPNVDGLNRVPLMKHIELLPDGSLSEQDGLVCDPFEDGKFKGGEYCDACKVFFRSNLDKWVQENGGMEALEHKAQQVNAYARDRSRLGSIVGTIGAHDMANAFYRQSGACMCGFENLGEAGARWEVDHNVPISRGGLNTYDNIQLLSASCNKDKGNRTQYEWQNQLPARYNEWVSCEECGQEIRANYKLCYKCKFGE